MSNNKLYLGNLDLSTSEDDIRAHFTECGKIAEILMPLDRKTKEAKEYAFIRFEDEASSKKALALDGTALLEKEISIQLATDKPAAPEKKKKSHRHHKRRSTKKA